MHLMRPDGDADCFNNGDGDNDGRGEGRDSDENVINHIFKSVLETFQNDERKR